MSAPLEVNGNLHPIGLTFTQPGRFIPQNVDLVHPAELLEHLLQLLFVHGPGDLPDEHLDIVRVRLISDDLVAGVLIAAAAVALGRLAGCRHYQLLQATGTTGAAAPQDAHATTTTTTVQATTARREDGRVVLVYHIGVVVVQRGMIVIVVAAAVVGDAVIVAGGAEVVVGGTAVVIVHIHEGTVGRGKIIVISKYDK